MNICPFCGAILNTAHVLVDNTIPKMANGDTIIAPRCKVCSSRISVQSTWRTKKITQKVILITGLCGAGKSSIGKKLEDETGYIHIDGDAVSKKVNWDIRNGVLKSRSGYLVFDELLDTIQVVLQLGYSVIATYVFTEEAIEKYKARFSQLGIACEVIILKTEIDVCINRDKLRDCWTAGEEFVLKWKKEQTDLAKCGKFTVIDNSHISLTKTCSMILNTYDLKKDKA